MSGYLEAYGAGDEKRSKIIRWTAITVVAVLVIGLFLYFGFRNYREDRIANQFVEFLKTQDYQAAYRLWGCTPESPCPDYSIEKFMEDWGPKSPYGSPANAEVKHPPRGQGIIARIRNVLGIDYSCEAGVIYTLDYGKGEPVLLYVTRREKTLSFAPWPVCNPRMEAAPPAL
ncbi:MAG: hypothetical protein KJZ78_10825 [Bryobacteraceae bacterium]|nr:hypothetical protein [Bryobacteraceae bacterium]